LRQRDQAGRRAPPLRFEQLLGRRRSGHHPRYPGVPPAGTRLERYRLQRRRGQVRSSLAGARRRHLKGRHRRSRVRTQHRHLRHLRAGHLQQFAPPKKTRDAVASAIAWKVSIHGISKATKSNLVGHRDLGQTDCPGDAFYAKLGEMRSTVNSVLKTGEQPGDKKDDDKSKDDDKKDDSKKDDDKSKDDDKKSDDKKDDDKKSEK